MDISSGYCPERRRLEQCNWDLVGMLAALAERLFMLIGKDHTQFMATQAECAGTKQEIIESRDRLLAHRSAHGC